MATYELKRPGVASIFKTGISEWKERHVSQSLSCCVGNARTEPPTINRFITRDNPCNVRVVRLCCGKHVLGGTSLGMQPSKASFARLISNPRNNICMRNDGVVPHMDLTMIRGNKQHRIRCELFGYVTNQSIYSSQFCLIELAETSLVRDLVDTVVIGVNELLPCTEQ